MSHGIKVPVVFRLMAAILVDVSDIGEHVVFGPVDHSHELPLVSSMVVTMIASCVFCLEVIPFLLTVS